MSIGMHSLQRDLVSYKQNKMRTEGRISGRGGIVLLYSYTFGIRSVRHLRSVNARYILPLRSFE